MNPSRPLATHVAVRDGRILGAGSLDELTGWGDYKLDRTFADKVLMPGWSKGTAMSPRACNGDSSIAGFSIAPIPTARPGRA